MLTSTDSKKENILYQDSIYVILWQPDPRLALIGKTDSEGNIKIEDKARFPYFYNLPLIPRTGTDSPEIIGSVQSSENVTISLSNESFTISINYNKTVKDGPNNYNLAWEQQAQS